MSEQLSTGASIIQTSDESTRMKTEITEFVHEHISQLFSGWNFVYLSKFELVSAGNSAKKSFLQLKLQVDPGAPSNPAESMDIIVKLSVEGKYAKCFHP